MFFKGALHRLDQMVNHLVKSVKRALTGRVSQTWPMVNHLVTTMQPALSDYSLFVLLFSSLSVQLPGVWRQEWHWCCYCWCHWHSWARRATRPFVRASSASVFCSSHVSVTWRTDATVRVVRTVTDVWLVSTPTAVRVSVSASNPLIYLGTNFSREFRRYFNAFVKKISALVWSRVVYWFCMVACLGLHMRGEVQC